MTSSSDDMPVCIVQTRFQDALQRDGRLWSFIDALESIGLLMQRERTAVITARYDGVSATYLDIDVRDGVPSDLFK